MKSRSEPARLHLVVVSLYSLYLWRRVAELDPKLGWHLDAIWGAVVCRRVPILLELNEETRLVICGRFGYLVIWSSDDCWAAVLLVAWLVTLSWVVVNYNSTGIEMRNDRWTRRDRPVFLCRRAVSDGIGSPHRNLLLEFGIHTISNLLLNVSKTKNK